jgi:hypothetical protein
MPQFYFDITDGKSSIEDSDGVNLPAVEAAEREAIISIADILRDNARMGKLHPVRIAVRDESGRSVFTAISSFDVKRPARD